ncbi:MAG: hypothetical protein WC748_04900 [Legionellales bacterium]|jgi:hypothetical protein
MAAIYGVWSEHIYNVNRRFDKSLVEEGLSKGRLLATRDLAKKMLVSGLNISQVA